MEKQIEEVMKAIGMDRLQAYYHAQGREWLKSAAILQYSDQFTCGSTGAVSFVSDGLASKRARIAE